MNACLVEVRARRREPLDTAALHEAMHSADAGVTHSPLGATPWLYLRLDALASLAARDREAVCFWLRSRACPVIAAGESKGVEPVATACDVIVADDAHAQPLLDNIERTPFAAMTLVQVLRATELLPLMEGLSVESTAFAALQAGPEFRAWLAAQPRPAPAPSGDAPLRMARSGATLSITLARPKRRNALSVELRDALVEALELVAEDTTIERAIIDGEGPDFCAGGDFAEFGAAADPAAGHAVRSTRSPAAALIRCGDRVDVRLHGACIGAGVELAAFGRRVVADAGTWFRLPELGFGLIPGAGGCVSLVRRIGRQRTAWLALSGQRIDAQTALAWGLVDTLR